MEPYRKKVDLPSGKDYWFVHLDDMAYPFPSEAAAELFALNHSVQGRRVFVKQGE